MFFSVSLSLSPSLVRVVFLRRVGQGMKHPPLALLAAGLLHNKLDVRKEEDGQEAYYAVADVRILFPECPCSLRAVASYFVDFVQCADAGR